MYCIILNSPVLYSAVQYRVPPLYKNEFFFFAFLDESDHFQCFPKGFKENPKKSKKKFGIGIDPRPPGLENSKLFLGFFSEGFPYNIVTIKMFCAVQCNNKYFNSVCSSLSPDPDK